MGTKKNPDVNLKEILLQILPYDQNFTTAEIKKSLEVNKDFICGQDYSGSNLSDTLHQLRATGIIQQGKQRRYHRVQPQAEK